MFIGWFSTNFRFFFPIKGNFVEDLPMVFHGQFGFNCPGGFKEEAF
jgi:hypothetical protein